MAILQGTLSEELISRSEKAVLKGIFRASQLNEGLIALQKVNLSIDPKRRIDAALREVVDTQLEVYLRHRIEVALESIKIPAISKLETAQSE
jgi:type II secretory pathway predicted ATPase ExeA